MRSTFEKGTQKQLIKEIEKHKCDISALQETKIQGTEMKK